MMRCGPRVLLDIMDLVQTSMRGDSSEEPRNYNSSCMYIKHALPAMGGQTPFLRQLCNTTPHLGWFYCVKFLRRFQSLKQTPHISPTRPRRVTVGKRIDNKHTITTLTASLGIGNDMDAGNGERTNG